MTAGANEAAVTIGEAGMWLLLGLMLRWALWNPGIDWWRDIKTKRKAGERIRLYGSPMTGEVTGVKVLELDGMLESSPTLEMWDEEVSRWVPVP